VELAAARRQIPAPSWRRGGQSPILCSNALMEGVLRERGALQGVAAGVADGDAERRMRLVYREGGHDDLEGLTELSLEAFTGCFPSPLLPFLPFSRSSLSPVPPLSPRLPLSLSSPLSSPLFLPLTSSLPLFSALPPLAPFLSETTSSRLFPTHSHSHQRAEEFGAIEKIMSLFSGDIPERRSEVGLSTGCIRDDFKSFSPLVSAESGRSQPLIPGCEKHGRPTALNQLLPSRRYTLG
jgi:hypothetical protein